MTVYAKVDGKFEPINGLFSGHPNEGLWYVKRIKNGTRWTWLNERIEDLPEAMIKAQLEPYRDEILLEWQRRGEDEEMYEEISLYDVASILFDTIAKVMKDVHK